MQIDKSIQKIALIFFFILGSLHILAHLMLINEYMTDIAYPAKKILEIPFILTALTYGFISFKISLVTTEKTHNITNIVFAVLIIAVFGILIYLNLFIPDRI